jgi:adenine-specific DNA-methyltransferase
VDGLIKQDKNGPWWFRKVEGWIPADPNNPNNGQKEKVLIIWRKLTDDLEQDNQPNLKLDDENWKVRLIEGEFMKRMWDVEGV